MTSLDAAVRMATDAAYRRGRDDSYAQHGPRPVWWYVANLAIRVSWVVVVVLALVNLSTIGVWLVCS